LSEDASVVYENNSQVNAGSYTVTATISRPNYEELTLKALLTIQKAQALITAEEKQEHVYDGAVKSIRANLDHGETDLTYSPQQGYANAGSYTITVGAEETANYLAASKQVTLIIHQGQPADKPVMEGRTVTYDGKAYSLEAKNLPTGANVIYENNEQTDAGIYEVTARITHPDYGDQTLSARLTIQKAGQRIEFREVGRLLRDVGQVELEVSSDSGLPVGLHSSDELVGTIVGRDLLIHRLGTTRITATQEGDKNHEPAEPVTITVMVEDAVGGDPVRIHQALSPNGDGINDFLILEGIKDYPDNKLTILTRNGIRVFTIDNYDNESRVFKGIGNFNSSGGTLPQGTYFYVLEYKDRGIWKVKKGWFVLKM
jgi:gliding motility-associated-like protein